MAVGFSERKDTGASAEWQTVSRVHCVYDGGFINKVPLKRGNCRMTAKSIGVHVLLHAKTLVEADHCFWCIRAIM